jgi:periplasmic protein TonB
MTGKAGLAGAEVHQTRRQKLFTGLISHGGGVSVNELGNLTQCIVGSDSSEVIRARRRRGRALAVSVLLETAVIVAMLLWPLMTPAVLTSQPILTSVPIVHTPPHVRPEVVEHGEHQAARGAFVWHETLRQPPQIPSRVDSNPNDAQPPPEVPSTDCISCGTSPFGNGFATTNIPKPGPDSSRPVVMSGGVMEARLVHRVEPDYPKWALTIHLSGTVQLRAIIGTDGSVRNVEVVSGNPILAKAARAAVEQWRYQPTLLSGTPVEVETLVTVQFQME